MKLVLCLRCHDVFKLAKRVRRCACKHSSGKYLSDGLKSEVQASPDTVVLGFLNYRLRNAIMDQQALGDRPDKLGREFTAFIMPDDAPNVVRTEPTT